MHTACALSFLATAAALNVQSRLTTAQRAGLLLSPQPAGVRKVLPGAGAPVPRGGVDSDDWWDGATLGSCVVRRFTDEMAGDRWMLWYSGRSASFDSDVVPLATGAVGLAQSTDGVVWERLAGDEAGGACLVPNEDEWWGFDTSHVGVGDVHVMSSRVIQNGLGLYWMFYFGGDGEELANAPAGAPTRGGRMSIGVALSNDGVHWGRVEGEHPSGAALEPAEGESFVGWPQALRLPSSGDQEESWLLYYHALDEASGRFAIGSAVSSDCVKWTRRDGYCLTAGPEGSFDAGGVSARCVVRKGAELLMFYEAVDAARSHTIGLARSADGLSWERIGAGPVFSPSAEPGAWDGVAVARPWVVPMDDGSARLYYVGRGAEGAVQRIGMARSEGNDWTRWTRWAEEEEEEPGGESA